MRKFGVETCNKSEVKLISIFVFGLLQSLFRRECGTVLKCSSIQLTLTNSQTKTGDIETILHVRKKVSKSEAIVRQLLKSH